MRKLLLLALLSFMSFTAISATETVLGKTECSPNAANHNLTVCINSGKDTRDVEYLLYEQDVYKDGTHEESIVALQNNAEQDSYAVMSTSTKDMNKKQIVKSSFSIILGDIYKHRSFVGCYAEITPTSVSKSVLQINKYNNGNSADIYCS